MQIKAQDLSNVGALGDGVRSALARAQESNIMKTNSAGPTRHTVIDKCGNVIELDIDATDRFGLKALRDRGWIVVNGLEDPWTHAHTTADKEKAIDPHRAEIERRKAAHAKELTESADQRAAARAKRTPVPKLDAGPEIAAVIERSIAAGIAAGLEQAKGKK
jgi:hypothetical protein